MCASGVYQVPKLNIMPVCLSIPTFTLNTVLWALSIVGVDFKPMRVSDYTVF